MPSLDALVGALFVLGRLSGLVLSLPVVGTNSVPRQVKLLMVLSLTAVLAPVVPPPAAPPTIGLLVFGMVSEIALGVAIGFVARLIFSALSVAGEIIGMQTGHAAAAQFDPSLMVAQGPLGLLATLLASAMFLGLDLHLAAFRAVGLSFQGLPPGAGWDVLGAGSVWIEVAGVVVDAGSRLAAPIVVLVFLINVFVAVVTRLAPSMNAFFALGILLTMMAGQLTLFLVLPHMLEVHMGQMEWAFGRMQDLIDSLVAGR
jgi:flagellar biosynthetic protein FliR